MRIPWLPAGTTTFPPVSRALDEPDGLLAAGGDLSPARLLSALMPCGTTWPPAGSSGYA